MSQIFLKWTMGSFIFLVFMLLRVNQLIRRTLSSVLMKSYDEKEANTISSHSYSGMDKCKMYGLVRTDLQSSPDHLVCNRWGKD